MSTETIVTAGGEVVVVKDLPYYESSDGEVWALDVYYPSAEGEHALVVVFHGNPVFGQTKEFVRSLAAMIAERGAVVVVPTWGNRMSMSDMHAIAREVEGWTKEQGPCAVFAAVDLASSYGAGDSPVTVVGVTTGVLPAQSVTFDPSGFTPSVDGCRFQWVLARIDKAILFDTDWMLVPNIWDEVLADDPSFLGTSSYWDKVGEPRSTRIIMLAGEITAPETNRSLEGKTYTESEWVQIRDPDGRLAEAFAASGTLDDGSMSFTDVTQVVVSVLKDSAWDAELLIVPGVAHAIKGQAALAFVTDLVFAD